MADASEMLEDLGPWRDADLSATARMYAGTGADDGIPPNIRFLSNVAKLIRRRRAQPTSDSDQARLGIYLLAPEPPQAIAGDAKRIPMLNNGQTPLTGRLWFVSAVAASGYYVELAIEDDDDIFRYVDEVLQLGSVPALILDPRLPVAELRFYPDGLRYPDICEIVRAGDAEIKLDEILRTVDKVYSECFVTPDAQLDAGKLWLNTAKWWPSSKAEALVQLYLKAGLTGAFPTCTTRHEQPTPRGRLDLEIEESDPLDRSQVTRHALLELKVLRSYRHTGASVSLAETLDWVKSGVEQASACGVDKGSKYSALLCFDMRKEDDGDACFAGFEELAKRLKVFLGRWYLYATSKQYRQALAGP